MTDRAIERPRIADRADRRRRRIRRWPAGAAGCARRWRSPVPPSSPRSPIWTRAISPPTSRPAPNTATGCSGSCCSPMSSRCCSRASPPSSASSPARNLAEMCRDHFPQPVVWAMWGVSEIAAMATDLAEFLGGAIGLSLLLHMPLLAGMVVTAIVTYGLLMCERLRLPAARTDHRLDRRRDLPLLSRRNVHCAGRLGGRRSSTPSRRRSPTPRRCCSPSASSAPP